MGQQSHQLTELGETQLSESTLYIGISATFFQELLWP